MNPEDNQNQGNNAGSNGQSQNESSQKDPVLDFTKGNNSTVMGVLSYLGPLVIIPYLMEKKDEFVRFHTKQGLVLFGLEVVVMILGSMMYLYMIGTLFNLVTLVLSIIGIVNVVQGQRKELPVIGSLANSIKI